MGCAGSPPDAAHTLHIANYQIDKTVLQKHLAYLSSDQLAGRKVGTTGSQSAQRYLIAQLTKFNIKPFLSNEYLHPFSFEYGLTNYHANNIVGVIESKLPSNKFIVLSAHYDHLGVKNKAIYNGADDNASGVSALLMIAQQIAKSPLAQNVIVLLSDAEENNLMGATYFLKHHRTLTQHILLNMNLDMLSGSKTTKALHYISDDLLQILTRKEYLEFKDRHYQQNIKIKRGFKRAVGSGSSANLRRSWQTASDHGAFYRKNIPFIYYGVGLHENYHTKNDDYLHANKPFLWHSTNIIYDQLRFISEHINNK